MKKLVVVVGCFIFALGMLYSHQLDYIRSGEYAYYMDTRAGNVFFRGYLFFAVEGADSPQWAVICRNHDLKTNKELNYLFYLEEVDGSLQVKSVEGLTEKSPPEFSQGLVDFMNHNQMYQSVRKDITFGDFFEDPWDGFSLLYFYNKTLPFFRFLDITVKGEKTPMYTLNTAGILGFEETDVFFKMKPVVLEESQRESVDLTIPNKTPKKVTINGLNTTLDESWIYSEGLGSPGYWLQINCLRDSQVAVEIIPEQLKKESNLTDEEICRLSILKAPKVDYNSLSGYSDEDVLYVTYSTLDDNNVKNYQFFIIKNDNSVINFSTFADIFDSNQAYYQNIINQLIQ